MVIYKVQESALKYAVDIEAEVKPQAFKWSTTSLEEVLAADGRLEASVFHIEARQARDTISQCKWPIKNLLNDFVASALYPGRFKRAYVARAYGEPFFMPSQIVDLQPRPTKYISKSKGTDFGTLKVKQNSILITRSGTIGSCTIVTGTLAGCVFSDDVIRVEPKVPNEVGYIYIFLKSKTGRTLIETNNYGAVVSHIEPEHLANISIPDPTPILKKKIHDLAIASFQLRDESNSLLDEAQSLLKAALQLPEIDKIQSDNFDPGSELHNYSVNITHIDGRLEASYHLPIVDVIKQCLVRHAKEVTTVGDARVSKDIILPGRFKRVYVEEGQGVVFFGGKQLFELDPSNKKYLSLSHHAKRIKGQLTLHENMTLITSSGTIGKVNIAPKHWDGWTANQHIIRVAPTDNSIAGYVYTWLASDYAYPLITRFTYGAVVDEIDDQHIANVPFPLLHDTNIQKIINDKALEANSKRFEAYKLEQQALKILNEQVIFAVSQNFR